MQENTFSREGKVIFYREWNETAAPKGVIQIVHGMVEHTLRYDGVAKLFNEAGYIVVADEHRGHGETDKDNLGYAEGDMYEGTLGDMHCLMQRTKAAYPNLPYILFGFSYGSFLTQSFIGRYMSELDAVVIGGSSKNPWLDVHFGKLVSGLGCMFGMEKKPAKLIKKLTFDAYDRKFDDRCFLSTNAENNKKYFADPYCSYICSYNFYRSFFNGLCKLYTEKYAAGLRGDVPVLLISGKDDPVGNMGEGVIKLYEYYKKQGVDVTLKLYENSRHEFLNEDVNRAHDILAFLDNALKK